MIEPSLPINLSRFSLGDLLRCGSDLKRVARDASSMEGAAEALVRYLHEEFADPETGKKSCALVRFYLTRPYGKLGPELQSFARRFPGGVPATPHMKCLVLLATAGDEPAWNSPLQSQGHRAILLPSPEIVEQAPMISQLIKQFGLGLDDLIQPSRVLLRELEGKTYNVFHVEQALGSPYIPAQSDFVIPHEIRSVIGFGGLLPSGDLYVVIVFSHVPIPRENAEWFRSLALDVKSAIFPFRNE